MRDEIDTRSASINSCGVPDYPHLEGTWPFTKDNLNATFGEYPEKEIRSLLGENAAAVYGFDLEKLRPIGDRVGPTLAAIRGAA